jgi:AbrB family looped-hinge helix DNA binding protein
MTPKPPLPYRVKLDSSGRVVLPVNERDRLNLHPGDELVLEPLDGGFRLATKHQVLREVRARFGRYARPGQSVVDELLAERRAEAARE